MFNNAFMLSDKKLTAFIFAFAFLMYANTIGHDYAWDDSIVITENARVQKGFKGIPDLFIKYNSAYKSDQYGYRPVTLVSFAVEYSLLKNNPHAGHFMNVIYFAVLCCVLFMVLRKLFYNYTNLAPLLITLLFIVHPIHVEVVANIKSRDELFALLFSLLSLGRAIAYHNSGKVRHLIYCSLLYMLAFLSKESAIVFLGIIPLTLLYLKGWQNLKLMLKPGAVVLVLGAISLYIVKLYMTSTAGMDASKGAGIYYENGILGNSFFFTGVWTAKLANAFTVLAYYLKNFLYPVHLVYYYGYNQVPVMGWDSPLVILSFLLHTGLLAFAVFYARKHSVISYSIFFYFVCIFFYTHLILVLADTMADRFMFTPSLGLIMLFVFLTERVLKLNFRTLTAGMLFSGKTHPETKSLPFLKYGSIGILFILCILTFSRNKVWKNNETLITHDMPELENSARANYYYADMLQGKLRKRPDAAMESDMIARYRKSISISKESYYSFTRLGSYFNSVKKYDDAVTLLDTALKYYGAQADPHYYIGEAYYGRGDFKKAKQHLQRALELAPEVSITYYYLGLAFAKSKEFEKAIELITLQKQKFGESLPVYEALGTIYFEKGDMDSSTKATLEMLKYGANPEAVYKTVIGRYQFLKMDKEAAFYYNQALSRGLFRSKAR